MTDELRDLASDLRDLAEVAARPEEIDRFVDRALDALQSTLGSDLATFIELRGEALHVIRAGGPLATGAVRGYRVPLADAPGVARAIEMRRA